MLRVTPTHVHYDIYETRSSINDAVKGAPVNWKDTTFNQETGEFTAQHTGGSMVSNPDFLAPPKVAIVESQENAPALQSADPVKAAVALMSGFSDDQRAEFISLMREAQFKDRAPRE